MCQIDEKLQQENAETFGFGCLPEVATMTEFPALFSPRNSDRSQHFW